MPKHGNTMTDDMPQTHDDQSQKPRQRLELWPHRSLSPKGFKIFMMVLGGLMLTMGLGFFLVGAWPVIGFMGAEIGVLYIVFKLNYRAARQREHLMATKDTFRIERISVDGEKTVDELPTPWLKAKLVPNVKVDDDDLKSHEVPKLIVSSHGKSTEIGAFLHVAEKRELLPEVDAMLKDAQR